ncbi:MAG: dephospho-CoA kinase [Peptococcaceae bacterium]
MIIVGLTGGIASGKSTVSNYLRQLGAVIIDADQLARKVVEPGERAWQKIQDHFGGQALNEDQTLNRKKIGEIVFADTTQLEILNKIIHPEVIREAKKMIAKYQKQGNIKLIVIDAPLLIEAGMEKLVDEVWVINVEPEVQIKRTMERDKLSRDAALNRLKSQLPTSEKLKYADRIIDNNKNVEDTLAQVKKVWLEMINKQNYTGR